MTDQTIEYVEMIRRRNKAGFRYVNKSLPAERVEKAPSLDDLAELAGQKWWDSDKTISGFVNAHDGLAASAETRLRIVYDDQRLFVAFLMEEPAMDRTNALITAPDTRSLKLIDPVSAKEVIDYVIEKDDCVQLCLDFQHGSQRYVRFLVNLAGVGYADEMECQYSESIYPKQVYRQRWDKQYRSAVCKGANYWCAAFEIPWSSVGLTPEEAGVFGINATRSRTVGQWEHHYLCPGVELSSNQSAVDFFDLYLTDVPVSLEQTDFGLPVLAENTVSVKLRNTSDKKLSLTCGATLTNEPTSQMMSEDSIDIDLAGGQVETVQLKYALDWRGFGRETLALTIVDKPTGRELLRTLYFLGHRADISAEQPYQFDGPQPNPDPSDEDFLSKKRNYVLSRLPRFQRYTTVDGAPSDFTLRSDCGRYEFNLMASGVLKQIAEMLASLFPAEQDRLIAAVLLAHHKAFSMHIGPHVAMHRQISPLSALRLNAGHCYSRALVWLGIVRNLRIGDGEQVYGDRAHMVLVLGHVMATIDVGSGERTIFDPTTGAFYYRWDNKDFATAKELEADPTLPARVTPDRSRFFTNLKYHRPIPAGRVVFPQGAVGE